MDASQVVRICKQKNDMMKDIRKMYVKPEICATKMDDVTLCNVSIGISGEPEDKPGRMGAKANYDFEDDADDTSFDGYTDFDN